MLTPCCEIPSYSSRLLRCFVFWGRDQHTDRALNDQHTDRALARSLALFPPPQALDHLPDQGCREAWASSLLPCHAHYTYLPIPCMYSRAWLAQASCFYSQPQSSPVQSSPVSSCLVQSRFISSSADHSPAHPAGLRLALSCYYDGCRRWVNNHESVKYEDPQHESAMCRCLFLPCICIPTYGSPHEAVPCPV